MLISDAFSLERTLSVTAQWHCLECRQSLNENGHWDQADSTSLWKSPSDMCMSEKNVVIHVIQTKSKAKESRCEYFDVLFPSLLMKYTIWITFKSSIFYRQFLHINWDLLIFANIWITPFKIHDYEAKFIKHEGMYIFIFFFKSPTLSSTGKLTFRGLKRKYIFLWRIRENVPKGRRQMQKRRSNDEHSPISSLRAQCLSFLACD